MNLLKRLFGQEKYRVDEVFGVSNQLIKTYIEREEVDIRFKNAMGANKQVIIYGSSKQGKTYIILKHLKSEQYTKVECSPQMDLIDIYSSILRQNGAEILDTTTTSESRQGGVKTGVSIKLKIPVTGEFGVDTQADYQDKFERNRSFRTVTYNLGLAQDILEILKLMQFKKFIILENFHYLNEEVQRKFAFDLRTFQDESIIFIILGIWRERNRLAQFNGDLQDRLLEVPVEPWGKLDFEKVLIKGSKLMNVDFSDVENELIDASFDSIGVFQELCKESCISAGVNETSNKTIRISIEHLNSAKVKKLYDYSGRHIRSFESFCISSKTKTAEGEIPLYIPYYFINILLTTDFEIIESGLERNYIQDHIKEIHHRPDDVRSSDMSFFLHNIIHYQVSRGIKPPLFDYDMSGRSLKIIDSTLYFFLRFCNRQQVLDDIKPPVQEIE
jgi:hypothetical protein